MHQEAMKVNAIFGGRGKRWHGASTKASQRQLVASAVLSFFFISAVSRTTAFKHHSTYETLHYSSSTSTQTRGTRSLSSRSGLAFVTLPNPGSVSTNKHRRDEPLEPLSSLTSSRSQFAVPSIQTHPQGRLLTGLSAAVLNIHEKKKRNPSLLLQLGAAATDQPDEEDDDENSENTSKRKRDRLKDWLSSKSSTSPMVQMQRVGRDPDEDSTSQDDDDDDDIDDKSSLRPPQRRVKARLEGLFAGMPSMNDILYGSVEDADGDSLSSVGGDDSASSRRSRVSSSSRNDNDDAWFQEERQAIMDEYENMLNGMLEKIEAQRQTEPESVPENAPAMIKSVLRQEMDTEIAETKEKRAQERLDAYEREQRATLAQEEASGTPATPDGRVQRLMDESEEEYEQQAASRAQLDEFLAYEAEAFKKAAQEVEQQDSQSIVRPQPEADLDQWALERLEDMSNSLPDEDGSEMVQDILDESVTDLRQRMEKEKSQRGSIRPETLKEWQMYRAIATRLAADLDNDEYDDGTAGQLDSSEMVSDEEILGRLNSWKEYVVKEDVIRKEGGLTRGPKLPFAWQEQDLQDSKSASAAKEPDTRSKADVRKQINRMSIEALESLLVNSDAARREKLQKEIDFLKSELESKDYLDWEEPEEDEDVAGPVDMTGVFKPFDEAAADEEERKPPPSPFPLPVPDQSLSQPSPPPSPEQPPPSTPFFDDDVVEEVSARQKPPPNTPFFSEDESSSDESVADDSKLGSMDEQKLQAMYRRANARTKEEQDRIRSQWEEFQQLERAKREESGLGGSVVDEDLEESSRRAQEDAAASAAALKYDMEDVVSEDGDIDAAKILSAIGPRPVRGKKESKPTADEDDSASFKSSVDKREVEDSLYRSVSAVGGGRWKDDPEAKAKDQAEFSDFLRMESEMRQQLDDESIDDSVPPAQPTESDNESSSDASTTGTFDDVQYANEAMASLGARPKPPRTRKVDPRELSDNGGVRGSQEDTSDDDEEEEDVDFDIGMGLEPRDSRFAEMPEWLKRENAPNKPKRKRFLNMEDIDEAFDDDQYEKNMRQLAEYERRRSGKQQRQMGIDISDVLGPRDTEDYKDYKYDDDYTRGRRSGGWGAANFEGRKANLLEYIELDVAELNSLMDHKASVHATGVSQYLPRINKPFKEFGAIFRLEGVLVDLTGLQLQAWTKVAEAHGFNPPSVDDVRLAAVTQPELAVNHIFVWTDDFIECGKIALTHRRFFCEVFDEWAKENNISTAQAVEEPVQRGSLAMGEETVQPQQAAPPPAALPTDERQMLDLLARVWTETANQLGRSAPSHEEVFATVSLSPDIAVREVFRWTVDPQEVDKIVSLYRSTLNSLTNGSPDTSNIEAAPAPEPVTKPAPFVLNEAGMMELHYQSWTKIAEMFGFEAPTSDEVLGAFVINDPTVAVRDGFGWTTDEEQVNDVVDKFTSTLDALIQEKTSGVPASTSPVAAAAPQTTEEEQASSEPASSRTGPSKDEIVDMHAQAWVLAATAYRFTPPTLEQVQLAMDIPAEEAVTKIFRWTGSDVDLQRAASVFREELKHASDEYVRKYNLSTEPTPPSGGPNGSPQKGPSVSDDDLYQAAFNAWSAVATRYGLVWPEPGQVIYAMSVGPEEAIASGFGWADTHERLDEVLAAYKEELAKQRSKFGFVDSQVSDQDDESEKTIPPVQVNFGTAKWVQSLLDVEMGCAIISYLDRMQVDVLMEYAGLSDLIGRDKRVTISNGYKRDSQQMLGAALRLERRPDQCVVFDASPYASIAAHDVEMRNVAMIDPYPRYELLSADQTSSGFEELTAMNIRRLFGERVYDQPMLEDVRAQPVVKKQPKTKYFWDDD